ncbi:MAG: PepSY domain-containing protein [Oxalobacteraceae bacterium]
MQTSLLKTLAAAAVATLSLNAFASSSSSCTQEPKSKWMAEKDVNAKLVAQGLKVNRIKTEGSCYEAYVIAKDGKKSEMLINPADGKFVSTETSESKEAK